MLVDVLEWTGDGAGNKKSTRFQPVAILTKGGHHSDDCCFWNGDMPVGDVKESGTAALISNVIDSVESDGFTTGSDNRVERSGNGFAAVVLGGDLGRREVVAVEYTGDGSAQRDIPCGFTDATLVPALVIIGGASSGWVCLRTDDMPEGDGTPNSHGFQFGAGLADRIYRFGADFFSVDDTSLGAVNAAGNTFHAIVVSAAPSDRSFATFQYTGDGSSARLWHALSEQVAPDHASVFQDDSDSACGFKDVGATRYPQGLGQTDFVVNGGEFHSGEAFEKRGFIQTGAAFHDSGREFYGYVFGASPLDAPSAVESDARVGHGKLGLREALRSFKMLTEQAEAAREADVELRLGKIIDGFVLDDSNTYVAPVLQEALGYPRDVVSVRTFDHPVLARVESRAACRATAGTFFYDASQLGIAPRSWDDGDAWWDEQILDQGIVGHWKGDDKTDSSGNGNDLDTDVGTGVVTTTGLDGDALDVDGTNASKRTTGDGITVINAFASNSFAWAQKVRFDALSGNQMLLRMGQAGGANPGYKLLADGTTLEVALGDGSSNVQPTIATGLSTGRWYSIFIVIDRVTQRLHAFVDGELQSSTDIASIGSVSSSQNFGLGVSPDADSAILDGQIDQTIIWDSTAHVFTHGDVLENAKSAAAVYHNTTLGSAPLGRTIPSTNTDSWGVGAGFLYVHLPDNGNVDDEDVLAQFGFYLGTRGVTHPVLGDEILSNGDFETLDGSDLANWEAVQFGGSSTVGKSATTVRNGTYAAQSAMSSAAAAGFAFNRQAITGRVAGAAYRLFGWYLSSIANSSGVLPLVWIGSSAGGYLDGLGRDVVGSGPALSPTNGEWRAFCFDFIADAATFDVMLGAYAPASTAGNVFFDDVSLQRIFSWQFREPRLGDAALPRLSVGLRDLHFGKAVVGSGALTFWNGDADYDEPLAGFEWLNQECFVRAGGRFADGEAILLNGQHPGFAARVQKIDASDQKVTLALQDARATIHREFPPNIFSAFSEQALDPKIDGKRKPVLFGADTNVPVNRIGLDGDEKPTYLLADPLATGLHSLQAVYAYTGDEAADRKDTSERVTLVESSDFSKDLSLGTITLLRDVGPIRIDDTNSEIDFNDGSADRNGTVAESLYASMAELATAVQTAMNAAGSGDTFTVSYSESDHKITIATDGGTLTLKTNDGANADRSIFKTLGYTTGSNETGATSYEADDALYEEPEKDLVVRADVTGLKDDADGSYTGTAGAAITLGVDLFAFIWETTLGFRLTDINAVARATARSDASETLKAYIDGKTNTGSIFERLERSNFAAIVVKGDGEAVYKLLRNTVPGDALKIEDRDIVTYAEQRLIADSYAEVRVLYDRDAATGAFKVRTATESAARLNVRPDEKEFETYLTDDNVAQTRADQYIALASSRARVFRLGVGGLLDEKIVGDLIRLTRSRAFMSSTGSASQLAIRIRDLSLSLLKPGQSEVIAVEHIQVTGG